MLKNFQSYQLAKKLYLETNLIDLKGELRDQLHRASLSICLNLAEGSGKASAKDRKRFFQIAFGSTREVQALLELIPSPQQSQILADQLAACLWRLLQNPGELRTGL